MKRDKDTKRKKGKSESNYNTEKFNVKRRSSITGSVMDTSSSSTNSSSVESDEPEIFDQSAITTGDPVKGSRLLSGVSVAETDAVLTALNVLHNGRPEIGHRNIKKNVSKNLGICASDNNKEIGSSQQTKKQTRREKRKKWKDNSNIGNVDSAEKSHMEKSVDNSMIIQRVLHLAESSNYSQRRSSSDAVKMPFGELQDCKKDSMPVVSSNNKAEVEVLRNSDLLHVYTTGNELRELLQRREREETLPKLHLSFDDKLCNSFVGTLPATSYENYANEVVELMPRGSSVKVEQKYAQWTKTFHRAMLDGDHNLFMKKFDCLIKILRKTPYNINYQRLDEKRCRERVIKGVLAHFSEQQGTYTIIHQLAATRSVQKCGSFGNHNKCRMIKTLLSALSWKDRRNVLRLQMQKSGKTPLHIAVISGQPCQIEALMYYEAPADILDFSKRAPIHYAVLRKDVYTVKMLLWYGADMSVLERNRSLAQLSTLNSSNSAVYNFLSKRKAALEKVFMEWTKLFVHGIWSPHKPFTDLHFSRLSREGDSQNKVFFSSEVKKRTVDLNVRYNVKQSPESYKYPLSLLFIIPTFYKSTDFYSDASNPHIYCTPLMVDSTGDIVELIKSSPILNGLSKGTFHLESAFLNPHNGYFYAYQLPRDLRPGEYSLSFNVDISRIREKAKHIMLAVQGIVCGPPDFSIWDKVKKKGKAKVD